MLHISVIHQQRARTIEHPSGPIEFGRVSQGSGVRVVLEDPFVSRDQMRLCELEGERVAIENLSSKTLIALDDGSMIAAGERSELPLPLALTVGTTRIEVRGQNGAPRPGPTADSWQTILRPARGSGARPLALNLEDSYEPLTPEQLAEWFETVISVQRSAAGSREFFDETARAVVELIGLDRAMVLLLRGQEWEIAASHSASAGKQPSYSRTILRRVVEEGRTFFRAVDFSTPVGSLMGVEAVVASPVFDAHNEEVVGALYGLRTNAVAGRAPAIRPLEAQLVQVLAAAVGAGLARQQHEAEAARSRVQFEQFFSSALARELERDETLLDGRDREITVLFSDIRGFSSLSETLGPSETCRLVGDIMERLTTRIVEHEGVVVDYIGDGLLAMWNAPAEQPRHAELAARAALAMQAELPALNEHWEPVVGRPLGLGIGLNTGAARVGNIGSRRRFKYGPLGHSVNLASRVESVTKQLGVPILLTGSTHALLGNQFATRRLCRARVVGIAAPVDLYELHGQMDEEWRRWRDTYEAALEQFEAGHWSESCQTIYPLLTGPDSRYDGPSLELVSRAIRCLKSPPDPFDPVVEFDEK